MLYAGMFILFVSSSLIVNHVFSLSTYLSSLDYPVQINNLIPYSFVLQKHLWYRKNIVMMKLGIEKLKQLLCYDVFILCPCRTQYLLRPDPHFAGMLAIVCLSIATAWIPSRPSALENKNK